jgi:hypothetical protein
MQDFEIIRHFFRIEQNYTPVIRAVGINASNKSLPDIQIGTVNKCKYHIKID